MNFIKKYKLYIFSVTLILSTICLVSFEFYKQSKLDKEGVYATGRISNIQGTLKSRNRKSFDYVFSVKGKTYIGSILLTFSEKSKKKYCKEGKTVSVCYLPSNPNMNRLNRKDWE